MPNFIIADWVIAHEKLTSQAKLVYAVLRTNSKAMGGYSLAITSHRKICNLLGMDIRTVQKALTSLKELRIISENEKGFTVRHHDPSYDSVDGEGFAVSHREPSYDKVEAVLRGLGFH